MEACTSHKQDNVTNREKLQKEEGVVVQSEVVDLLKSLNSKFELQGRDDDIPNEKLKPIRRSRRTESFKDRYVKQPTPTEEAYQGAIPKIHNTRARTKANELEIGNTESLYLHYLTSFKDKEFYIMCM